MLALLKLVLSADNAVAFAESPDALADCSVARFAFVVDKLELTEVDRPAMVAALEASPLARVLCSVTRLADAVERLLLVEVESVEIWEASALSAPARVLASDPIAACAAGIAASCESAQAVPFHVSRLLLPAVETGAVVVGMYRPGAAWFSN